MLKETCITQLKEEAQKNPDAKFYICMRNPPTDSHYENGKIEKCITLSPSENLTRDYRGNLINWTGFITKFHKEMRSPKCRKFMRFIKSESAEHDIYLVCICSPNELCHRFILLDMINNS